MNYLEIALIALGLSMDACAVAVCLGLSMNKATWKKMLIVGLYFGIFQGVMPIIGYYAAAIFADKIASLDHWIAFVLLAFLGGKMIVGSLKKEERGCFDRKCPQEICTDRVCPGRPEEASLHPKTMLVYALATSVDALAVGILFAVSGAEIFTAAAIICGITLIMSMVGVKIGNIFGFKIKSKAELIGGLILIIIGIKILIEHLVDKV